MIAVFTDMDGCLLDHHTYEWAPARPALLRLGTVGAPVILTTSKTTAEVRHWQQTLGIHHPSIVENGGAINLPAGSLNPLPVGSESLESGDSRVVLGWPRARVVEALRQAAAECGCEVRGFSGMADGEIARHCGMSVEQARLAANREFSEPFLLPNPDSEPALRRALEARGLNMTRGGRFHHAQRHPGKGHAVELLLDHYARHCPPLVSIGLGDGLNDEGFLRVVHHAVILKSSQSAELKSRLPHALVTDEPGPAAWSAAVLELLDMIAPPPAAAG